MKSATHIQNLAAAANALDLATRRLVAVTTLLRQYLSPEEDSLMYDEFIEWLEGEEAGELALMNEKGDSSNLPAAEAGDDTVAQLLAARKERDQARAESQRFQEECRVFIAANAALRTALDQAKEVRQ